MLSFDAQILQLVIALAISSLVLAISAGVVPVVRVVSVVLNAPSRAGRI